MKSRWAVRFLFFAVAIGVLWIAAQLTESQQLVISERGRDADESDDETMAGDQVVYREFDEEGREKIAVDASRGRQLEDAGWQLEGSRAQMMTANGRKVTFYSDRFREDTAGRRVVESLGDRPIRIDEEQGISFRTFGPLFLTAEVFNVDARVDFEWGPSYGHARSMSYRPGKSLSLKGDVLFQLALDRQEVRIVAQSLVLDIQKGVAEIEVGLLTLLSEAGSDISLRAPRMLFLYRGDERGAPRHLEEFHGMGPGTALEWPSGAIKSKRFALCFGAEGRWIESAQSQAETQFSVQTEDRYQLNGETGGVDLQFEFGEPHLMLSKNAVKLLGVDSQGSEFTLRGSAGLESTFRNGKAYDTLILGEPNFAYRDLKGRAGSIRLLHHEARILLSAGAQLSQPNGTLVEGEEILIANWNQEEREIFARTFVRFTVPDESGRDLIGEGDQVTLTLPSNQVVLLGSPAEFRLGSDVLRANRVEVLDQAGQGKVLHAQDELVFEVDINGQIMRAEAESLVFDETQGQALFRQVRQAQMPGMGEVSARELNLSFSGNPRQVERVVGRGEVVIQGQVSHKEGSRPYSCQADEFDYDALSGVLLLSGLDRDVVFQFDEGQTHRSRQLTFNLLDGSMHAGSETHEFTKTILNIKDKQQGDRPRIPE